jgi:hypothetical protein
MEGPRAGRSRVVSVALLANNFKLSTVVRQT